MKTKNRILETILAEAVSPVGNIVSTESGVEGKLCVTSPLSLQGCRGSVII